MQNQTFEIRDSRFKEKFMVDDAYLNGYARKCGISATGVYVALCRHADQRQESFPSVIRLADTLGITSRTVIRAVQTLQRHNIIQVVKRKNESGQWLRNVYVLMDKTVWTTRPGVIKSRGVQVTKTLFNQVTLGQSKETHMKETQERAKRTTRNRAVENDHGLERLFTKAERERVALGIYPN
jgi:biotin operon repressor